MGLQVVLLHGFMVAIRTGDKFMAYNDSPTLSDNWNSAFHAGRIVTSNRWKRILRPSSPGA
jgi:hypothetical protein